MAKAIGSRLGAFEFKSASLAALVAVAGCWTYSAAAETSQLIVRFREPQNTYLHAAHAVTQNVSADADQTKVEIVSAEQGVLKLSFASEEQAAEALRQLENNGEVLNVSRNNLYKPAVRINFRDTVPMPNPHTFLSVPFADLLSTVIPDVKIPTGRPVFGVDPLAAQDWALENIRLPLHKKRPTLKPTSPIITAVIDTGVDYNHEDLIRGMWRKPSNPQEVGYDTAHDTAKPFDVVHFDIEGCLKDFACSAMGQTEKYLVNPGHGTHCAGHVGAVANNSLGIRGVGAGTQMMALKFFYDVGEVNAGQGDDAAAIRAIDYAIKNGAKVISASWGGYQSRAEAEKSELKQALIRARDAGVLFIAAAGNGDNYGNPVDQDNVDAPAYPAAYDLDNVITVAAIDKNDQIAEFSNYGAKSVHIAAPGVRILSTIAGKTELYSDLVAKFKDAKGNEREADWSGTSMATPIVAGAASLLWQQRPNLTYLEIKNLILSTARKIPALDGKVSTGGTLDVTAALAALPPRQRRR